MSAISPENLPLAALPTLDAEFFTQIVEAIIDPVFVKDEQHRWVFMNEAFCEYIGYGREELLGRSDYDFFPAEQADIFWEKDDQVFSSGDTNINIEKSHRREPAGESDFNP